LSNQGSEHLAKSVLLEESGNPIIIRWAIWFMLYVAAAFFAWATTAYVDEVATAEGEVLPSGQVKQIQHLDGGRITEILVDDGDKVKANDIVMLLDSRIQQSKLDEANAQLEFLNAQKLRLVGFLNERQPIFNGSSEMNVDQASHQMRIFHQSMIALQAQRDVLKYQIKQFEAELMLQDQQLKILSSRRRLIQEELKVRSNLFNEEIKMRGALFDKGLNSKTHILSLKRQRSEVVFSIKKELAEVKGKLTELPAMKEGIGQKINEMQSQLKKNDAEMIEGALTELARIDDEIVRSGEVKKRHGQTVRDAEIRAPVSGIVHGLKEHTLNAVVSSGETILEIVPENPRLMSEIRISPRDIGHVKVGQEVMLKFTTYDFARYGGIKGKLSEISASTLIGPKGSPYYKGIVSFNKSELVSRKGILPIIPGMTVQGDIRTGNKTVLEYLLKPIFSSAQTALRER